MFHSHGPSAAPHDHGHGHGDIGASHGHDHTTAILNPHAAWFALASVLIKEWLYRLTNRVAKEEHSPVLRANALQWVSHPSRLLCAADWIAVTARMRLPLESHWRLSWVHRLAAGPSSIQSGVWQYRLLSFNRAWHYQRWPCLSSWTQEWTPRPGERLERSSMKQWMGRSS